ncbi:hypothetical protein P4O66_006422 [Electrophorus voltai]|uniref:Chromo domain-containing protein n=1 Tax=Electrophorus voltai TaxID=2609070 RepID=A0AAD8ZI37_9TELE|nr:hypothetical protein P4O66_006422 [Electrophorus voltai]
MPLRPWSHLVVDFVMDLPVSEDNTTILSIVDRFSKMVPFVPLAALPTVLEAADILFHQVFRQLSQPEDIVSDRGPQFTSWGWRELLGKLNITRVWVATKDGRAGSTGKINARYESLYTITNQINEVSYRIGITGISRASWAFHVSALKPMKEGSLTKEEAPSVDRPPPLEMEEGQVYRVRTLLDSQRRGRGLQYLVDWEGYGPEERSWVSASQILDPDLVTSFHRLHLLKPAPSQLRSRSLVGSLGGVLSR